MSSSSDATGSADNSEKSLKRSTDRTEDEELPAKRLKVDPEEVEDLSDRSRNKPPTRGVERISPLPLECLQTHRFYEFHRRLLVTDTRDALASVGKRVVGLPRFL